MTTETRLLTAEDLLRLHSKGVRGELTLGVLHRTMPTGREQGEIAAKMSFELLSFVKPSRLGIVTTSDSGVRLQRDPDTVREADVAYFASERVGRQRETGYSEIVPDLVVEIESPSDDHHDLYNKARMWLSYGVQLVWVVHPDARTVDVHRGDSLVETVSEDDDLSGQDILPGYSCPVASIFNS
ncbi:MAG: Uma2 family endonuclease [Chloroflexota bacterium]|nr:Uma2 family endonuclease [Chloroflexota bacterium]MDE2896620.1 Uma2 family endonuclease [Chloroflexota bacterium]